MCTKLIRDQNNLINNREWHDNVSVLVERSENALVVDHISS